MRERTKEARFAERLARVDLDTLLADADTDAKNAVLEDRVPDPGFEKRIESARHEVQRGEQAVKASQAALREQRQIVEQAEGQIALRSKELLQSALNGSISDLMSKARALGAAARKVRQIALAHGFEGGVPSDLVFGEINPLDPLANWEEKERLALLFSMALAVKEAQVNRWHSSF